MIRERIAEKLREAFDLFHLEVHDESYRHDVPAGAQSHFKVIIVSDNFLDKRMLQRHRAVYHVLAEELAGSIHALALHTYTSQEWNGLQGTVPASPNCRGAGMLV